MAGRAACKIKYKSGHHYSITQFGSPTAQIPLESGSSADKRFRTDLKICNKNCIIYVSQADVQSERRWIQYAVRSEAELIYSLFCFFSSVTKEFNQSEACFHILRWKHLEHPSSCSWALNTVARQERKHQLGSRAQQKRELEHFQQTDLLINTCSGPIKNGLMAVRGCIQQRSGNSCNGTGTMCIGACHSSDVERGGGGGGSAAWVTACPPYLLTQAFRSGEVTPASLCTVDKTQEVAVYLA